MFKTFTKMFGTIKFGTHMYKKLPQNSILSRSHHIVVVFIKVQSHINTASITTTMFTFKSDRNFKHRI